jgi:4,5-DOPA dioxygenase extradiol
MYPDADIPVAQIALIRGGSPADHERMGNALAVLRAQGVLIVGSGSMTHNLHEMRSREIDTDVPPWVRDFSLWMKQRLQDNDRDAMLDYRAQAPTGARNHPTEEHLLPLFVAMGAAAGGGDNAKPAVRAEILHDSFEYGILAMDMVAFH